MNRISLATLFLFSVVVSASAMPDAKGDLPISFPCAALSTTDIMEIPEVPGFPDTLYDPSTPYGQAGGPKVADIDLDGEREIIIAAYDTLFVKHYDGTNLPGWPIHLSPLCRSAVAVGNIDQDSLLEIVVHTTDGNLHVFSVDGIEEPGFPYFIPHDPYHSNDFVSPVLFDVDGDKKCDIVMAIDTTVIALRGNGSVISEFHFETPVGVCSTPAVGDINGDGLFDMIVEGWDTLYCFREDGEVEWRSALTGEYDGFSYSAPVLVDFDSDGYYEIAAGYHESGGGDWAGKVGMWEHNGVPSSGWPITLASTGSWVYSTPAVGDVDEDEEYEIYLLSHGSYIYGYDYDGTGASPYPVYTGYSNCEGSIVIGDINSDGHLELLFGTNMPDGLLAAYTYAGVPADSFPISVNSGAGLTAPAIADINDDGYVDIVYLDMNYILHLWSLPWRYQPGLVPWGSCYFDNWNTGFFRAEPVDTFFAFDCTTSVELHWIKHPAVDLAGYNIYRCPDSTCLDWTRILTVTRYDTVASDTTVDRGVDNYYFVTAFLDAGVETQRSNIVHISPLTRIEEKTPKRFSISVYPNPFNSSVRFSFGEAISGEFEVYNLSGDMISSGNFVRSKTALWTACNLPSGIYLVRLKTDKGNFCRKVVYMR